jgi:hypothetical protein
MMAHDDAEYIWQVVHSEAICGQQTIALHMNLWIRRKYEMQQK